MKNILYNPAFGLRLGLGVMYIISGVDLIRHPTAWKWAITPLPDSLENLIVSTTGVELFLQIQGFVELGFALVFLLWFVPKAWVKLVALLATIEMVLILVLVGVDTVTFRDFGILGASFGLYQLLLKRQS